MPSLLAVDPDEARTLIALPGSPDEMVDLARRIAAYFPAAQARHRQAWTAEGGGQKGDLPHFERVFRLAAGMADAGDPGTFAEYDTLLVLTAWYCVRPEEPGYLGSYPKALLCPLSHTAPPSALAALSARQQAVFDRRAPAYLRHLLCDKAGLRSCHDLESADLRQILRSAGFRLIRASAVPEVAFPGVTLGEDPAVRPWKLALRQELSDERAAELLLTAAIWKIRYDLRLVSGSAGAPRWNVEAFRRTHWEDAFLSLGVRIAPSLSRRSGLIDWRAVLGGCVERIGAGDLPPEALGRISPGPRRISHDSDAAIWDALDQTASAVLTRAAAQEPQLFGSDGRLDYHAGRTFRRWARLFDEISPQILSRLGVSAFTALRRVAPSHFGWGAGQLKPWQVEQEHGKWRGARGRALLRSAYACALFEEGLGRICYQEEQVVWQCCLHELAEWYPQATTGRQLTPYEFLYSLASRHGLTPLLDRDISHTAAISLMAGINLHASLPRLEGCWEMCLRAAIELHGGAIEVRLTLPDLAPLPLRFRKAVLSPLAYGYLHREPRWVRDFDLRMARESRCSLEALPGWWDDERIAGTPLAAVVDQPGGPAAQVLERLDPAPWVGPPAARVRFRALHLLLSPGAARHAGGRTGLSSAEIRCLLELARDTAVDHTNVAQVSIPAIRTGFDRLIAREDTRELLDSLLAHIGTAYETEIWGGVRKFLVLDVINDLTALTLRGALLHLLSAE